MRWGVVVLAACLLGACSGGGTHRPNAKHVLAQIKPFVAPATSPTTKPPATTTSTTVKPTDALAIAHALGCKKPEAVLSLDFAFPGVPSPSQEVSCTISDVDLDVTVFKSHAELARMHSLTTKLLLCNFAKAFEAHTPLYFVEGDDFEVSASSTVPSGEFEQTTGTLAQAKALSRALGLPIVTLHC